MHATRERVFFKEKQADLLTKLGISIRADFSTHTRCKDANAKQADHCIHACSDRQSTYVISEAVRTANIEMNAAGRANVVRRISTVYLYSLIVAMSCLLAEASAEEHHRPDKMGALKCHALNAH